MKSRKVNLLHVEMLLNLLAPYEEHFGLVVECAGSLVIPRADLTVHIHCVFQHRMKNILDSWLNVQAAWLYLEPIFGSQDIRNQIPVEGKMFEEVDENWKTIMENAIQNTLALVVVSQDQMLEKLQHSEVGRVSKYGETEH